MQPGQGGTPPRLPSGLFNARCLACWQVAGVAALVVASFWSLDLQLTALFSGESARSMGRFLGEFFPPDLQAEFVHKVLVASWETLAMSALGTLLAAIGGLALALPASRLHADDRAWARSPTRFVLNALRSVQIAAGLDGVAVLPDSWTAGDYRGVEYDAALFDGFGASFRIQVGSNLMQRSSLGK